jgi:transglutaminase-like putative cysteine protease
MYDQLAPGEESVPSFVTRLLRQLRPNEGWVVFLLALLAVQTLPSAANTSEIIIGLGPTIWLSILGLSLSWWLAHRRISGFLAAPILFVAGIAATLVWAVNVVNVFPVFGQLMRWIIWRLSRQPLPAPAITYFQEQWAAISAYGQRVYWWIDGLINGPGAPDNLVLIGLAGLLAWSLAAWAGWWIARHGRVLVGLLPTGIILAQHVYWAEGGRWSLVMFLGATTMLLVGARLTWLMRSWERSGTDYSPEMILDVAVTGLAIATLAMVLAPSLPFLASDEFSQRFWQIFESPYKQVEERVGRSFEAVKPVRSLVPPGGVTPGGLPRAHLLGGSPQLGREVVLRIRTRGTVAGEGLYWRGQTFAQYTGRGWENEPEGLTQERFVAGQPWSSDAGRIGGRPIVNAVEAVKARGALYAAGEPVSVDRPYTALFRAPGELVSLFTSGRTERYTVLSQLIAPDPSLLAAAPETYSDEFRELYLQLPSDLDPRLAEYAAEIAPPGQPAYDRALAIESALREMEYSLDVPAPPGDRELVSWFLFDLRKGYCDYFASAMVVLARLSGIPARLAVGYAPGSYDPYTDQYTITELQAHSWPELYFPGSGWVRFEPTPAQEPPIRIASGGEPYLPFMPGAPTDLAQGLAELRDLGAANVIAERQQIVRQVTLAILCGLLLLWSLMRLGHLLLTPLDVRDESAAAFVRLQRWGRRVGRAARPADTPREFALGVIDAAVRKAGSARLMRHPARAAAEVVRTDAVELVKEYEDAEFGPDEMEIPVEEQKPSRWARLWPALRRVWLAR